MSEALHADTGGERRTGAAVRPDEDTIDRRAERVQRILLAMSSLGRQVTEAIAEQVGDHELATNTPILVLTSLWLNGAQRPRALQELARLTSGGMTKQLDRLEQLGLLERAFGQVQRDRRAIMVSLTPDGRRLAEQIAEAVDSKLAQMHALVLELETLLSDADR
jgi:DNA-binding MarR family transcriptional regulator